MFLQDLSQENYVHTVSFDNVQRLLEFTSLHTFSNNFDLLCTKIRSADFQKRRLVILFFFQSRMRSHKWSIKLGSYSQTMHFLFVRLKRTKIATLQKYTDNARGQGLDLMHHRSAVVGIMWKTDHGNNCSLISLFRNSFPCFRVSEKLQVVPLSSS